MGDGLFVGVADAVGCAVGSGDELGEAVGGGVGEGDGVGVGVGVGVLAGTVPTLVIVMLSTPAKPGPGKSNPSGPTIKRRVELLPGRAIPFAN